MSRAFEFMSILMVTVGMAASIFTTITAIAMLVGEPITMSIAPIGVFALFTTYNGMLGLEVAGLLGKEQP